MPCRCKRNIYTWNPLSEHRLASEAHGADSERAILGSKHGALRGCHDGLEGFDRCLIIGFRMGFIGFM